jgi:3-methylfumaryl-CoA hydratase
LSKDIAPWIGRNEKVHDVLEPARTNALRSALGLAEPLIIGDPLPLLHHWLYFWNVLPPIGLGRDGHPAKGGFLPPISLPRRMWAGGRLRFIKPLVIGEKVSRTSTILDIQEKAGKSGPLVFVTVQHEISGEGGLAIIEEQDLVYRELSSAGSHSETAARATAPRAPWLRGVAPDPVLLFRYSALTMNSHRIHYDRPYAVGEEAYPGLVVHGPLQATLLADLAARNLQSPITGMDFRGQSPAFEGTTLHICGAPTDTGGSLWTEQSGIKTMVATVTTGTTG